MLPLYLHVNQNSGDDDDAVSFSLSLYAAKHPRSSRLQDEGLQVTILNYPMFFNLHRE